jgi:hypothetical protein
VHERGENGWTIYGSDISDEFAGLAVNIWDKEDYTGLVIFDEDSPETQLLFNLGGSRNNAAGFAYIDEDTWLLHTGRVFRERARPNWDDTIEIGRRSFFRIARVSDPHLLKKVFQFHLSRKEEPFSPLPPRTASERKAIDTGPFQGGVRVEVVFEAQHSGIVSALLSYVEKGGWEICESVGECKPDLVVRRGQRKVLFEVKSDASTHSLICAAGQCQIYNLDHRADRKIVVSLASPDEAAGWIVEALRELGIELVFASQKNSDDFDFTFDDDELKASE